LIIIIINTNSLVEALLYRPSLVYFFAHGHDFTDNRFFFRVSMK